LPAGSLTTTTSGLSLEATFSSSRSIVLISSARVFASDRRISA